MWPCSSVQKRPSWGREQARESRGSFDGVDPVRPEDIAVLVALAPRRAWADSEEQLLDVLPHHDYQMSLQRLHGARLCLPTTRQVARRAMVKLLIHGVPYLFPGRLGELAWGTPTAWTQPQLRRQMGLAPVDPEQAVVWPVDFPGDSSEGIVGRSLEPLAPWVPDLARLDRAFAILMGLTECMRVGRAREREWASQWLEDFAEDRAA